MDKAAKILAVVDIIPGWKLCNEKTQILPSATNIIRQFGRAVWHIQDQGFVQSSHSNQVVSAVIGRPHDDVHLWWLSERRRDELDGKGWMIATDRADHRDPIGDRGAEGMMKPSSQISNGLRLDRHVPEALVSNQAPHGADIVTIGNQQTPLDVRRKRSDLLQSIDEKRAIEIGCGQLIKQREQTRLDLSGSGIAGENQKTTRRSRVHVVPRSLRCCQPRPAARSWRATSVGL